MKLHKLSPILWTKDLQATIAFYESVKDKATIKTSIEDREYFMRDFSILDNNGYELVFGQHIKCD